MKCCLRAGQTKDGQKMGKSLGNVLEPGLLVRAYGADAVRLFFIKEVPFGQVRVPALRARGAALHHD